MATEDEERCPVTAQAAWKAYQEARNRAVLVIDGGQVKFPTNPGDHQRAGMVTGAMDEAAAKLTVVLILDRQDRQASSRPPFPKELDRLLVRIQSDKSELDTVREIADHCWLLWR